MTIIIVLVLPEGIILGADTQTTIYITEKDKNGKERAIPVNFFRNSQKIFDISVNNKIFALSQFGIANPGGKPLSNHVFSIREILMKKNESELNSVSSVSEIIISYFKQFKEEQRLGLGFYISGFNKENSKVIPCIHLIRFYKSQDGNFEIKNEQVRKVIKIEDYGLSWAGEGNWIIAKLLKLSDPDRNIPRSSISYHLLSLKDGVELTEYLIDTVIGFERFQSRFPSCGGKSRIAVLTPREFKFMGQDETDLLI